MPAAYLVSPIDLLPDLIPFLGRLDDALVCGAAVDLLIRFAPRRVIEEHLEALRDGPRGGARPQETPESVAPQGA